MCYHIFKVSSSTVDPHLIEKSTDENSIITIQWTVTYSLSKGNLRIDVRSDCSNLPTILPRNGLQFLIPKV